MKFFLTLVIIAAFTAAFVFASDLEDEEDLLPREELIPIHDTVPYGCGQRTSDLLCLIAVIAPLVISLGSSVLAYKAHNLDLSLGTLVLAFMSLVFFVYMCLSVQVQKRLRDACEC